MAQDDQETLIGPQIPQISENQAQTRLTSKLNHFFTLKNSKGLSLNQQLAAHPDFHAPGITESLLDLMGLDPWASNLPEDVAKPFWEKSEDAEGRPFDYTKVAQEQRQIWESKNPQIMGATASTKSSTFNPRAATINSHNAPRKRI